MPDSGTDHGLSVAGPASGNPLVDPATLDATIAANADMVLWWKHSSRPPFTFSWLTLVSTVVGLGGPFHY